MANVNTYSIRYATTTGIEHCIYGGDKYATEAKVGRIIDAAHAKGHTLAYVRVVAHVKRAGTKPLFELSRKAMDQSQLVHYCNLFHRRRVFAEGRMASMTMA